jgi:hypothetical protein
MITFEISKIKPQSTNELGGGAACERKKAYRKYSGYILQPLI